jgi:hypothetical protein
MSFRGKPLDQVDERIILLLKENNVIEQRTIEYKLDIPGDKDEDKKEFYADISSFANSVGGHIIYGVKGKDGYLEELVGFDSSKIDSYKLKLENMIIDGIDPRIIGTKVQPVPLSNSKQVIIIEIPRSWSMPHVVKFKNHFKFYSRHSAGKYTLDVRDLKNAFLFTETVSQKIRNFRLERISKIISGEAPAILNNKAKLVLHIIPFDAFNPLTHIDLKTIERESARLAPISTSGGDRSYNFDGILFLGGKQKEFDYPSYTQLFRNGIIESVDTNTFIYSDTKKTIPHVGFEKDIIESLKRYLDLLKDVNISPPFILMIRLCAIIHY